MASYVDKLKSLNLITPPKWLPSNVLFEGMTGSISYAVSNDSSDMDIVGFCMPKKEDLFPSAYGYIEGFGEKVTTFNRFQQHHIKYNDKSIDMTIYSISRFFQLCMDNNPNMIDALFLPRRCVLFSTEIYEHIRDKRHIFLHKGCWHKFRGYAYSQLSKITSGDIGEMSNPSRIESIQTHGYDTKKMYHVVRLILECEQILVEHDLDLERNSEILKSIRRGEWSVQDIKDWFSGKEKDLEHVYHNSKLDYKPNESKIKSLLIDCIEMHYGKISVLNKEQPIDGLVAELENLLVRYR